MREAQQCERGGEGGTRADEDGIGGRTDQPPKGPGENETGSGQTEEV